MNDATLWSFALGGALSIVAVGVAVVVDRRRRALSAASEQSAVILCTWIPDGINEEVADLVNAQMDAFAPDHFVLLQPDTYLFYFLQKSDGHMRSQKAQALLATLREKNERFRTMGIGEASGPVLTAFSPSGEMIGMPIGEAVTNAQKVARCAA